MKKYVSKFEEAAAIDIAYITKRLKEFKRRIINSDQLIEGILIDLRQKNNKTLGLKILDYIELSEIDDLSESYMQVLAKDIYYNYMNF